MIFDNIEVSEVYIFKIFYFGCLMQGVVRCVFISKKVK